MKVALIVFLLFAPPLACFGLSLPHPEILAIFITIIGLWLTEAVPLPVTGLLVPILAALYGAVPAAKAFDAFGSDILFLFLGCFLMGRSMERYGFDKRIAYFLLSRCMPSNSFMSLNLVLAVVSFTLSMWISNTSATAILTAVTLGILTSLDDQLPDPEVRQKVSVRLLLSCAFAASIGGLATPVGSPPNMIALKFLDERGIHLDFLQWMVIAIPISLCMLAIMLGVFGLLFPLGSLRFPGIKEKFSKLLSELGPIKGGEIQIAAIFFITVCLWILPGLLVSAQLGYAWIETFNSRLSMSVVGLIGGLSAFFLPVREDGKLVPNLEWSESAKVDWGTLMLFGGGLTLGFLLEQSGAAADLGKYLFLENSMNPYLLVIFIVLVSIVMSEFASNTAAASILIPLILGVTAARGTSDAITANVVLAATFAASFGFMLPVSTPPNAIVYGTGRVPAREMRRAGIFFDVAGAALIIAYMFFLQPALR